jgi:hypothetical protein
MNRQISPITHPLAQPGPSRDSVTQNNGGTVCQYVVCDPGGILGHTVASQESGANLYTSRGPGSTGGQTDYEHACMSSNFSGLVLTADS